MKNINKKKLIIIIVIIFAVLILLSFVLYQILNNTSLEQNNNINEQMKNEESSKNEEVTDEITLEKINISVENNYFFVIGKYYLANGKLYNYDGEVVRKFSDQTVEYDTHNKAVEIHKDLGIMDIFWLVPEGDDINIYEFHDVKDYGAIYKGTENTGEMVGISIVSNDSSVSGIYNTKGKKISNYYSIDDGTARIMLTLPYELFDNYIVVEDNKKYGLIDLNGNNIIEPKYDELYYDRTNDRTSTYKVSNPGGNYIAKMNGKAGIINSKGEVLVPFDYDIIDASKNYYILIKDKKMAVMSKNNLKFITDFVMDYTDGFKFTRELCCGNMNPIKVYDVADYLVIHNYLIYHGETNYVYVVDKNGNITKLEENELSGNIDDCGNITKFDSKDTGKNIFYANMGSSKCYSNYIYNNKCYLANSDEVDCNQNSNVKFINGYKIETSDDGIVSVYKNDKLIYESNEIKYLDSLFINDYYLKYSSDIFYKIKHSKNNHEN